MTNRQSRNMSNHWAQDTEQRPTKWLIDNPETCQNIGHKTQNKDLTKQITAQKTKNEDISKKPGD
jgi:hypothetical protein